jgi:hypothetical protein
MGRIRTVKPEFFSHEGLFDLEQETGLPIRLAFAGLWCECDREGRFDWRPRRLKTNILPYDDLDFSRVLDALTTRGFIVRYACPSKTNGKEFGAIMSFSRHQVINNRERDSEIPDPMSDGITLVAGSLTSMIPNTSDACPTRADASTELRGKDQGEGKGREGKGTGREGEHLSSSTDDGVPVKSKRKKNSYSDEFNAWWKVYPGGGLKLAASKQWTQAILRIIGDGAPDRAFAIEWLLSITDVYAGSEKGRSQYVPHAERWLRDGGYDSKPETWANRTNATRPLLIIEDGETP